MHIQNAARTIKRPSLQKLAEAPGTAQKMDKQQVINFQVPGKMDGLAL
jgi:hypothetical protein